MSHDFRDRDGGHHCNEISTDNIRGVTGWTPHFRKFAKRLTRREMRREHHKAVRSALLDYEQELEERRELEEQQYIAILDEMYEDDWSDFQINAEDDYFDDRDYIDDSFMYFDDEPFYNDDPEPFLRYDIPPRCPGCGRLMPNGVHD